MALSQDLRGLRTRPVSSLTVVRRPEAGDTPGGAGEHLAEGGGVPLWPELTWPLLPGAGTGAGRCKNTAPPPRPNPVPVFGFSTLQQETSVSSKSSTNIKRQHFLCPHARRQKQDFSLFKLNLAFVAWAFKLINYNYFCLHVFTVRLIYFECLEIEFAEVFLSLSHQLFH